MAIYNGILKATVGVKDVALWKGPRMATLTVVAVAAPKAIRHIPRKMKNASSSDASYGEAMSQEEVGAFFFACASPGATCV